MASEEDLRRERELEQIMQRRAGINSKIVDDLQDMSNVLNSQVQLLQFQKAEKTQIRSLTREANKLASEGFNITAGELGLQKNIAQITKDQLTVSKNISSLNRLKNKFLEDGKNLVGEEKKLNREIVSSIEDQIKFSKSLKSELALVKQISNDIADNTTVQRFTKISNTLKSFGGPIKGFAAPFQRASEAAREAVISTTGMLKDGIGFTKEKAEELGLTEKIQAERKNGSKVYGVVGAQSVKLTKQEREQLLLSQSRKAANKEILKSLQTMASAAVLGAMVSSFFALNKAQTEFRRLTGQSVKNIDTLNSSLITAVDYIQQASAATQQFGINATALFSNINLTEAAELTNLMGLSAEEANNLALATQSVGGSLDDNVKSAIAQVNAVNAARKTAISQKIVLQDVAKVSSGLTVAFGGQVDLLAEAAAEARALGLNLSQVEKIADSLLDIETSIKNEFVAETILGEELELGRARFYAQTDNVLGLVKELRKNEGLLNGFIRGGKIERQAAADALGLQVEDMGKFILLNQAQLGISTQAAAAAAGVTEEQLKQLTIQEAFNKSVSKVASILTGAVEPVMAALANNAWLVYECHSCNNHFIFRKINWPINSHFRTTCFYIWYY
jgi:hypothetical protein